MEDFGDLGPAWGGGRFVPQTHPVGVHDLSEFVFCPRAGLLSCASASSDSGEEEPPLGPRLDGFHDYDELRFAEELEGAWGELRLWLTGLAPALLLTLVVWRMVSPLAGLTVSLPVFYLAARIWDTGLVIVALVRERAVLRAAPTTPVNLAPQQMTEVNWWSLRKAGFECLKPRDPHVDDQLTGKPWRLLVKETQWRIPVIRKHRGDRTWGPQHVVRAAAYCRLVESCEGGRAPFAVLLFADSYDGFLIPNTPEHQQQLDRALEDFQRARNLSDRGQAVPPAPADNRCQGCHWGWPVSLDQPTILEGVTVPALKIEGIATGEFHSVCGDKFRWTPAHAEIERRRGTRP